VESSVSTIDAGVRPWRTATIVAGTVAAVELVVLLAIGVVLLGPTILDWTRPSDRPAGATPAKKAEKRVVAATPAPVRPVETPPVAPQLSRAQTSVLVLNGNGISGAAATTAEAVRARRYRVAEVGNAPRADYGRSLVMYRPGYRGEALRLGRDLGIRLVTPLDGLRRSHLHGAHVAVIIGAS
jgi:hypothetical protein